MALIALVGASETLVDGSLRALVTVAGETLIERQAARLSDAGVTHLAVAVGTVPAELLATCDRIRRRGLKVTAVRAATDPGVPELKLLSERAGALPAQGTQPTQAVTATAASATMAITGKPAMRAEAMYFSVGLTMKPGMARLAISVAVAST